MFDHNRWGVINVEYENHCDFVSLRNFAKKSRHTFPVGVSVIIQAENIENERDCIVEGACTCSHSGSRALKQANFQFTKLTLCSLCLSLSLSTLKTTIVSTSLVSIANALHRFN